MSIPNQATAAHAAVRTAVLCIVLALGLGNSAHAQKPAAGALAAADYPVNKRMAIAATAEEHAHVLTEMNEFLTSLHAINAALAAKDFDA